jgi:hypothetical protein
MLGSSRVAAQLAASQEGLSSMSEWVSDSLDLILLLFIINVVVALKQNLKFRINYLNYTLIF